MILKEKIPDAMERILSEISTGSEIQIAIAGDIDENGHFGERWLLATSDAVMIVSNYNGKATLVKKLPLKEISSFKTQPLIGSSALEALTSRGGLIELIGYSNVHSAKFSAAAKRLEQMAKGEELTPITDEGPNRCPKCGILLADGSKVCPRCVQKSKVIVRLMSYLKPYWHISLAIGLISLLSTAMMLVPPYLTRTLVDDVLNSKRYDLLGWIILAMVGLSLVGMGLRVLRGRTTAWLGSKITYDIRGQLYEMIQLMSLRFFDKHKTGELMSRVSRDTGALQDLLAFEVPFLIVNFLMLIGIGGVLLWMNWRLAILTLIPAPLVALGTGAIWDIIRSTFRKVWHRWSQLSTVLNDALSGIRVVKGFAQERKEIDRFSEKSYDLFLVSMKSERMWATYMPILSFLWGIGSMIVWYFGGRDVMDESMTLGTLMAFLGYLGMFYGPLEMVTEVWSWISRSFAAAERIFEILDTEPEAPDESNAMTMPEIQGAVEFKNVTFGYDRYKPVKLLHW